MILLEQFKIKLKIQSNHSVNQLAYYPAFLANSHVQPLP
jgi:hypothetical protein